MEESTKEPLFSWAFAFIAAVLLAVSYVVYGIQTGAGWHSIVVVALAGMAMYYVAQTLLGSAWGWVTSLTLMMHPLWVDLGKQPFLLQAESLKLIVLAGTVFLWQQIFLSANRWVFIVIATLVMIPAISIAWLTTTQAGLVSLVVATAGLLLAIVCAFWQSSRAGLRKPTKVNFTAGIVAMLVIPAAGLLLVGPISYTVRALDESEIIQLTHLVRVLPDDATVIDQLTESVQLRWGDISFPGFGIDERNRWAWPSFWPVVALMGLGLVRSVIRGFVYNPKRPSQAAWMITLFALAVTANFLIDPLYFQSSGFLPLATLAVLMVWFGIGDTIFGMGERIRLAPPDEEQEKRLTLHE